MSQASIFHLQIDKITILILGSLIVLIQNSAWILGEFLDFEGHVVFTQRGLDRL